MSAVLDKQSENSIQVSPCCQRLAIPAAPQGSTRDTGLHEPPRNAGEASFPWCWVGTCSPAFFHTAQGQTRQYFVPTCFLSIRGQERFCGQILGVWLVVERHDCYDLMSHWWGLMSPSLSVTKCFEVACSHSQLFRVQKGLVEPAIWGKIYIWVRQIILTKHNFSVCHTDASITGDIFGDSGHTSGI